MRSTYPLKRLGEVLTLEYGKPLPPSERVERGKIPAFGANGILCWARTALKTTPSIIVGRKGSAGEIVLTEGPFWPTDVTYYVEHDTCETDLRYLFHLLKYLDLGRLAKGVKPGINRNDVYALLAPVPPLVEQQRLVAILEESSKGLARATACAERNLLSAKELFDSCMSATFTSGNENWRSATISDLVEEGVLDRPLDGNHGEIHPKKSDFVRSGVPFIMASDLIAGSVDLTNCNFISEAQASSLRKGFARDGDVLLSHKGTVGRVAILSTDLPLIVLTPQVTYYRTLRPDVLDRRFLYFALQDRRFQRALAEVAGVGSTRSYIGITKQLELSIALPAVDRQKVIANQLEAIASRVRRMEAVYRKKAESLGDLKAAAVCRIFAGELTSTKEAAA